MKILFLDIDGVLNNHEYVPCPIYADKVLWLNHILRYTSAKIVLTSAWRYNIIRGEMNLVGMQRLFESHGIVGFPIDITRPDTIVNGLAMKNERGQQITDWLLANPQVKQYCVLDNDDLGIAMQHGNRFVQTFAGLDRLYASHAIERLNMVDPRRMHQDTIESTLDQPES